MKHFSLIEKHRLEALVISLREDQRKTLQEIAEYIKTEKGLAVSREAVRNFLKRHKKEDV